MRLIPLLGIAALAVTGCSAIAGAPPSSRQQYSSTSPVDTARVYAHSAQYDLALWADNNCLAQPITDARVALARLSGLLSATGRSATDPTSASIVRTMHLQRYVELADLQIATQLAIADAYFVRGCLNEADGLYRDIVGDFRGARYEAARQRAQIGVDDVRERRRSTIAAE